MTFRAYRRKNGSMADLRPLQDVAWALVYAKIADSDRQVALAILFSRCQFANAERPKAVSIAELEEIGLARRTVYDALSRLLAAGIITHEIHGGGQGNTAVYSIVMDIRLWKAGPRVRLAAPFLFEDEDGKSAGIRTERVRDAAPNQDPERVRESAPHKEQAVREAVSNSISAAHSPRLATEPTSSSPVHQGRPEGPNGPTEDEEFEEMRACLEQIRAEADR